MKYTLWFLPVLCLIILIQACGGTSVTEDINRYLEETVDIEADFEKEGKYISKLERKDKSLYEEIISLGKEDQTEIDSLAEEAADLAEERKEFLEKEKETIEASKTVFMKVEPKIKNIKEDKQREKVEALYETMQERYCAYEEVYEQYSRSLDLTKELYADFQDSNLHHNELYQQVKRVNDSYETVSAAYDIFNAKTKTFNELKMDYAAHYEPE